MKAVPLAVAGAFHTRIMQPAVECWPALDRVAMHKPRIPVISNVDARPHTDPAEIRQLLIQQDPAARAVGRLDAASAPTGIRSVLRGRRGPLCEGSCGGSTAKRRVKAWTCDDSRLRLSPPINWRHRKDPNDDNRRKTPHFHRLERPSGPGHRRRPRFGRAIAGNLAAAGAKVACAASAPSPLPRRSPPSRPPAAPPCRAVRRDRCQQVNRAVDEVVKTWGGLNILVNNAGITRDNILLRMKDEQWDAVIQHQSPRNLPLRPAPPPSR